MSDCERVRDELPTFVRGELSGRAAATVAQHLESCGDCSEESELVALLQRSFAEVPAGLEARVVMAVRTAPVRRGWRYSPRRLAMAATVAAVLFGGTVYMERQGGVSTDNLVDAELESSLLGWMSGEELPLHRPSVDLDDLTDEELVRLLEEFDS